MDRTGLIDEGKREGLSSDERTELVELRRQKRVIEMEAEISSGRVRIRAGERRR